MMNDQNYTQAIIARSDLARVLRGGERPSGQSFESFENLPILDPKETLVRWLPWSNRPYAIVVNDDDYDDFMAWANAYHADLLPISSWCHLFYWSEAKNVESKEFLYPDFHGLEAAWTGAIITEAASKTKRSYNELSLTTCCATRSFTLARSYALYGAKYTSILLSEPPYSNLRPYSVTSETSGTQRKIFDTLLRIGEYRKTSGKKIDLIVSICQALSVHGGYVEEAARQVDKDLSSLFITVPGIPDIHAFSKVSAEDSVRLLRAVREAISEIPVEDVEIVLFLAGFIIAQIGGSERDLRLSEQFNEFRHDVALWATVIGGLGSENHWGDAFSGLGRLVARELTRPVRVLDAPECDISLSELNFIERKNPNYLLKIRTANKNILRACVKIGVNFTFYPPEPRENKTEISASRRTSSGQFAMHEANKWRDSDLKFLANKLMPYLKSMLEEDEQSRSMKRSKKSQAELKFKD